MDFLTFIFFDLISFILHIIILAFCYRFFVKRKCNILSNIADKQIDDYFKAYDNDFENLTDTINDMNSQEITKF